MASNQPKRTYQKNNSYQTAFTKAQDKMIEECRIPPEDVDDIATNMQYLVNWRGYKLDIDVSDDTIEIVENGKTFKFSKSRFLLNRVFVKQLAYAYQNTIGDAFIRIKQNYKDNTIYSIFINKRRY